MPRQKSDDPVKQMPIYLRRSQKERLEIVAASKGIKPASLVGSIVDKWLEENDKDDR